jgi:hypothetical protein
VERTSDCLTPNLHSKADPVGRGNGRNYDRKASELPLRGPQGCKGVGDIIVTHLIHGKA